MSVDIRRAGPDDVETFFAIQRATSLAAFTEIFPPDRYPFPDADVRERWHGFLGGPEGTALLAEADGEPIGIVAFLPAQLYALYVLPDEWGSGVGSGLHDAAVAGLRELGPEARLWVLEANTQARRFYERRGWQLDGRERVVPFPRTRWTSGIRYAFASLARHDGGSGMAQSAKEFFEGLETSVDPARTAGMTNTYLFEVDGQQWTVAVDDGTVKVTEGDAGGSDVEIATSEETFQKIASGEQNPTSAYMTGKIKVKGDMGAAMKLQKLFG